METWIKVTDELPPADVLVLACGLNGGRFLGRKYQHSTEHGGSVFMDVPNSRGSRSAAYWMHIPDAPK